MGAVLGRLGLNLLRWLDPPEPPNRYCRRHPGELIDIDVKLDRFWTPGHRVTGGHRVRSRGAGREYIHVCVDATRLAYVEVLANETAATSTGFLERAVAWFAEGGVVVRRVMTDEARPLCHRPGPPGAEHTGSGTCAPVPIGRAQMGRPRDSSRPCSGNGPMPPAT